MDLEEDHAGRGPISPPPAGGASVHGMSEVRDAELQVHLFGVVRVRHRGHVVKPPPGNVAKVLALLALNGGCMNRDTLVERLWPDTPIAEGRHQLRNVLARLRAAVPVNIERQGALVVLGEGVWCDVDEFVRSATRALSGVDDRAHSHQLALHAQRLWRGQPLEAWRYDDWAVRIRTRVFLLQERLWELLATAT